LGPLPEVWRGAAAATRCHEGDGRQQQVDSGSWKQQLDSSGCCCCCCWVAAQRRRTNTFPAYNPPAGTRRAGGTCISSAPRRCATAPATAAGTPLAGARRPCFGTSASPRRWGRSGWRCSWGLAASCLVGGAGRGGCFRVPGFPPLMLFAIPAAVADRTFFLTGARRRTRPCAATPPPRPAVAD
jgi:hypothetical protein